MGSQTIHNMRRLGPINGVNPEIFTFEDRVPGQGCLRFNVLAHGIVGYTIVTSNMLAYPRSVNGSELAELLRNADLSKFAVIQLFSCHSAEGGDKAVGLQLAQAMNKPVVAFTGQAWAGFDLPRVGDYPNPCEPVGLARSCDIFSAMGRPENFTRKFEGKQFQRVGALCQARVFFP